MAPDPSPNSSDLDQVDVDTIVTSLQLEEIDRNLYRGHPPYWERGRLFGGVVAAQALAGTYGTIDGLHVHSLHSYFFDPGILKFPSSTPWTESEMGRASLRAGWSLHREARRSSIWRRRFTRSKKASTIKAKCPTFLAPRKLPVQPTMALARATSCPDIGNQRVFRSSFAVARTPSSGSPEPPAGRSGFVQTASSPTTQ